ncbi:MAG: Lrp/AsnC family transcriptional regulator [Nanoarchaeales archaeon]|nr:Lrp/AsnC family transcriptional regulator [Nanoarchaeales archaeon]
MKLSRNEKKTLRLLLENARVTDTEIGNQLKITSQAVHKIKEKLSHRHIIKNYTTEINYAYLGVHIFAIAMIKILPQGRNDDFVSKLMSHNVMGLYNIVNNKSTHILKCGFTSMEELWEFFDKLHSESSEYVVVNKVYTFPYSGFVKNSSKDLFDLLVEQSGEEDQSLSYSGVKYHYNDRKPPQMISLNDNEKGVLKLLVDDSSMSCCKIAESIPYKSLTHSGVNKIKKKLELNEVVDRYTVDLDYKLLGVELFAFIFLKKKNNYWKLKDGISQWALNNSNVMGCYKLHEDSLHILQCGFRSLDELNEFVRFLEIENGDLFEVENVFISSLSGLIQDSSANLFKTILK